jgi:hypothetical protein
VIEITLHMHVREILSANRFVGNYL